MDVGAAQGSGDGEAAHGRVAFVVDGHGGLVPMALVDILPDDGSELRVHVRLRQRLPAVPTPVRVSSQGCGRPNREDIVDGADRRLTC
jgi:hypothetical protein